MPRRLVAVLGALLLIATLAGCASAPEPVTVPDDAVIVDVRTPQEYADGHLDGARLYDVSGGQLAAALGSFDPDVQYFVYCRSGNRSAQAVTLMREAGLTDVVDLGSLDRAAQTTGLAIVR